MELQRNEYTDFHKVTIFVGPNFYVYRIWQPSVENARGLILYKKEFIKNQSTSTILHLGVLNALEECLKLFIKNVYFDNTEIFKRTQILPTSLIIEIQQIIERFDKVVIAEETPVPEVSNRTPFSKLSCSIA